MNKPAATKNQTDNAVIAKQQQAVAVLQPARLPYHPIYQERYGVDGIMWRALVEAVYPSAKTPEGIILAVSYCRSKNYDVMKKFVHVVPIWNTALKKEVEGVWESVAALRATAFRTGEYAGCDTTAFGPTKVFHFDDEVGWGDKAERVQMDVEMPEWAQVTVYRLIQGVRCAFPGPRVTYLGAYGCKGKSEIPNDKWGVSGDSYMLEKCAEAAALRKAFPEETGGVNTAEEMEGRKINIPGPTINLEPEPTPPRPTRLSAEQERAAAERLRKEQVANDAHHRSIKNEEPVEHDAETGEITEPEKPNDGPAASSSPDGGPQTPSQPAAQEPDTAAISDSFQNLANELITAIQKTGRLSDMKTLIQKRGEDIELLRTEAEEIYKQVSGAIEAKKQWFAK